MSCLLSFFVGLGAFVVVSSVATTSTLFIMLSTLAFVLAFVVSAKKEVGIIEIPCADVLIGKKLPVTIQISLQAAYY